MDIRHPTCDEWAPRAEALFNEAHLPINQHEMFDLYWKMYAVFTTHLDVNPRVDYDGPFRAQGCAKHIFKWWRTTEQHIGALAYIESLKSSDRSDTRNMGKIIEEELLKIFMTGVLPPTPEEYYKSEFELKKE